ncbi:hypothetical protein [Secundilactobacillus collinoides]|uniref:hypothetical protein n=1 Tax=Secundilactobacillus collinoides TaxID=33960 RepID=UPI001585BC43|nr:hypothetical protein [Secundilactobacillus collinoides]
MDDLCTTVWELRETQVAVYLGNYTDYLAKKTAAESHQQARYDQFAAEKKRLKKNDSKTAATCRSRYGGSQKQTRHIRNSR